MGTYVRPHVVRGKTLTLPAGYRPPGSKAVRVSVSFDDAQFDVIRSHARDLGVSFGEAVRSFLDAGINAAAKRGED